MLCENTSLKVKEKSIGTTVLLANIVCQQCKTEKGSCVSSISHNTSPINDSLKRM
jgi:hypothetical protein